MRVMVTTPFKGSARVPATVEEEAPQLLAEILRHTC